MTLAWAFPLSLLTARYSVAAMCTFLGDAPLWTVALSAGDRNKQKRYANEAVDLGPLRSRWWVERLATPLVRLVHKVSRPCEFTSAVAMGGGGGGQGIASLLRSK